MQKNKLLKKWEDEEDEEEELKRANNLLVSITVKDGNKLLYNLQFINCVKSTQFKTIIMLLFTVV